MFTVIWMASSARAVHFSQVSTDQRRSSTHRKKIGSLVNHLSVDFVIGRSLTLDVPTELSTLSQALQSNFICITEAHIKLS